MQLLHNCLMIIKQCNSDETRVVHDYCLLGNLRLNIFSSNNVALLRSFMLRSNGTGQR